MGRKVHPTGFRLKVNKTWDGRWYAEGEKYVDQLHQDMELRNLIREHAPRAGVSRIEIERYPGNTKITVHTAKPGILIGRKGETVKKLRAQLTSVLGQKPNLDIKEIKYPDIDAYLVSRNVADQLERRISYRRAMKRAMQQAMRQGAKGIKVEVSGRLGGADMARRMWMREGRVPLQTLRADIDYAQTTAVTTYSAIGVKVWVYKGDVLDDKDDKAAASDGVYVSE